MDKFEQLNKENEMDAAVLDEKLKKAEKKLDDMFVSEIKVADLAKLKEMIVKFSKEVEEIESAKAADPTLNSLKEQLKDLNGGYNDARKEKKNRLQYIILKMQERGML